MKIIFAVFDYLHTDYRVYKTANTFVKNNIEIKLYGITDKRDKKLLGWDNIKNIERLEIINGFPLKLNMLIFWHRLFYKLLFTKNLNKKNTILYCHDIFPLLPIYLISKIKKIPFIYDSHEFTYGNHHYENRPFTKWFWRSFEKFFIKRASKVITVSQSIADEMEEIYKFKKDSIEVITNLPIKRDNLSNDDFSKKKLHNELGFSTDKKIVLYQGGLLFNNGLEVVIKAFNKIRDLSNDFVFVLIGNGPTEIELKHLVKKLRLEEIVFFKEAVPQSELFKYTACAYLGICLIKNSGKSFYYSTPNKMFEYMQAGVPQLASNFPEISRIVKDKSVGITLNPDDIDVIVETIISIDEEQHNDMVKNCFNFRDKYYWESIEGKLLDIVEDII